ncbi:alpha/beta hydrolase [Streptomyces sp. NPDC048297]|uniref:alpha/beta hydrolase n=1 Tax=Streptomyces sp. NPDC048297 TaxID=3365531 RepID=UPI0037208954
MTRRSFLRRSPGQDSGTNAAHATTSRLKVHTAPPRPRAAVLFLHGGRVADLFPPPSINLPELRMRPFRWTVRLRLRQHALLLASVRYRHRGWNGEREDAASDAHSALRELSALAPGVPVVLVGHSMGGRAALRNGGYPSVRGVVALAAWCPPDEPVSHLRGRTVGFVHDERDRITPAEDAWAFARQARGAGANVHTVSVPRGGHTMVRGARRWHRITADLVTQLVETSATVTPTR